MTSSLLFPLPKKYPNMLSSSSSFPSTKIPFFQSKSFNIRSSSSNRIYATASTAFPSLYDVLGLSKAADSSDIKTAYRKLALSCHPDVYKRSDASPDEFMRIHAAYSTLSDPGKRADYDRGTSFGRSAYARSKSANYGRTTPFNGNSRRTWETDQCW